MRWHADSQSRHEPLLSRAARKRRGYRKARIVLDCPPPLQGWRTTDEDEIALRRWRGRTEIVAIEALEPGTFRVQMRPPAEATLLPTATIQGEQVFNSAILSSAMTTLTLL